MYGLWGGKKFEKRVTREMNNFTSRSRVPDSERSNVRTRRGKESSQKGVKVAKLGISEEGYVSSADGLAKLDAI